MELRTYGSRCTRMKTLKPTKTKLTLSMRSDLIAYGKQLAKRKGTSLSEMLQDYLDEERRAERKPVEIIEEIGKRLREIEIPEEILREVYDMVPDPPRPLPDIPLKQLRREYHEAYAKRKGL